MNELQVFDYNNKMVRTIERDGELWWVLKDVCKILKLSNPTSIANRFDEDEVTKLDLGGQVGMTNIINESGLYSVILRSDKPEAKPFRKWVTSEVLPTIRKTGNYSVNSHTDANTAVGVLKGFLQTQQQQFSILMQNQQLQTEQLTAITNLITSTLPQSYKPPFTRWMDKIFKQADSIGAALNLNRRQILHKLYTELQDSYDIDLSEHTEEYCYQHGIQNNGKYTLNAIGQIQS